MSVRLCSCCGGNTWSVNFRKFFILPKKISFFQNLQGDGHFSLYFPIKTEMA